jgi:PAS domain S-box-containing protein
MAAESKEQLLSEIRELKERLAESEQLIEAIKAGEVDAFAINAGAESEIYTLQSGDYAYRVLIEEFGEGALNITGDGLIVYTNTYFCELIKRPYDQIIGTSITDIIHPDSRQTYLRLFEASLKGKSKGEINLVSADRTIPVYISFTSLQPKLPAVGIIITDLTGKKQQDQIILNYQKDLESKNLALTRSNSELASFAYIASHDLQEPLRKIQVFANWITDKNYETFSDVTKDYFDRILKASKRMQHLITALLDYSRISKAESAFFTKDLNELVIDVKTNLRELLDETHAAIVISKLPVIRVIPHQVMQLFSNIFINAIKYRKPDTTPRIEISARNIPSTELKLPASTFLDSSHYWEIRIKDNGIGFEQKNAERIFELFQRLHGRSEYEGTGIGLAICSKIAQNHNGYIIAEGQPGVGATFIIYLPVNM